MEKQSVIVSIAIALIVGFALGLLLTLSLYLSPTTGKNIEIKKQFLSELREKGYFPPEPETITDAHGKVKNISDNTIILVLENRFDDPLQEFLPKTMNVRVSEKTEIFKLAEKPFAVFEKEQKAFEEKIKQYGEEIPAELLPPDPFTKVKIGLSEIKEGDIISVLSDSDFKGKSELTAASIQVEQSVEQPEEMPAP